MPTEPTPPDNSFDLLGLKPFAKSVEILTQASVNGAGAFLSRICLPAAKEFGLLLGDNVRAWRSDNATRLLIRAEQLVADRAQQKQLSAPPRIVAAAIELGSWSDAEEVQQFWAGLLASACTEDGRNEGNLMFLDILSKLTVPQARILEHICTHAKKVVTPAGWIGADDLEMTLDEIRAVSGLANLHQLDLELDHLRSLEIIGTPGGFNSESTNALLTPTPFALQMYVRCQGSINDPISFYALDTSARRSPYRSKQSLSIMFNPAPTST